MKEPISDKQAEIKIYLTKYETFSTSSTWATFKTCDKYSLLHRTVSMHGHAKCIIGALFYSLTPVPLNPLERQKVKQNNTNRW